MQSFRSLLFLLLLLVHQGHNMDEGDGGGLEELTPSLPSSSSSSHPQVELSGPRNFVALGGNNLTIRYRLSPSSLSSVYNNLSSTPFASLVSPIIQLLFLPQDGSPESLLASQALLSTVISPAWQEVIFECGLIVRGGYYSVRLVERVKSSREEVVVEDESEQQQQEGVLNDYDYTKAGSRGSSSSRSRNEQVIIISNVTIRVQYPVIDFEVPHRLETYTRYNPSVSVSFGLTRSLCKAKLPLPPTIMTLSMCTRRDRAADSCSRNFLTLLRDPLQRLQSEGRVKVDIDCHFWGKNATYRVQIQELETGLTIAKSSPIRVEWSPRYSLNLTIASVLPCPSGKSVRVVVGYPDCILPERDKVRLYGYDTPVPSLLAIKRLNYIGEKQIRRNEQILDFSCNLFTPRFSRYCFQYISTAVDDSVSIVVETCVPTFSPAKFLDGGWGPWSEWSPCSSTCGPKQGKQFRYRFCDSPQPAFGANFCQGDSIEERVCDSSPLADCSSSEEMEATMSNSNNNNNNIVDNEEEMNGVVPGGGGTVGMGTVAAGVAVETLHSFGFIPLHPSLNMNLTTTVGCECGCILDNIQPGTNYSLVVIISSNQSSCGDQDEEDHHHLKWVLSAKEERSRIRIDVVDVDLHCMKLAFRDGNTSDSNLLDVFTSSVVPSPSVGASFPGSLPTRDEGISRARLEEEQIVERQEEPTEGGDNRQQPEVDEGHEEGMTIRVESTGASLSIAASDSNQHDCTFQFLYLVAYYQATVPSPLPEKSRRIREWIAYDFWTFLLLKLVLSFFVVALLCSTFGGCATKVYKKYRYKQLRWNEGEEEIGTVLAEPEGDEDYGREDVSRCTSVTLMSFDHSYWKRLRILRLKYFLLKPKPLNRKTAQVKSYPTTPVHNNNNVLLNASTSGKNKVVSSSSKTAVAEAGRISNDKMLVMRTMLGLKQQSLSESELVQRKCNSEMLPARVRTTGGTKPRSGHKVGCPAGEKDGTNTNDSRRDDQHKGDGEEEEEEEQEMNGSGDTQWSPSHFIVQDVSKKGRRGGRRITSDGEEEDEDEGTYGEKYKLITRIPRASAAGGPKSKSSSCSSSSCSTRKGRPAFISVTMPAAAEQDQLLNDKIRKEQENFKRRQWSEATEEKEMKRGGCNKKKFAKKLQQNNYNSRTAAGGPAGSSTEELAMRLILQQQHRDKGKSQISVATIHSLARLSSSGETTDSTDRVDIDDADHDFEMDYYDYDVLNAGNIPGSYLGLEPAFVLWNSEMYPSHEGEEGEEEEEEEDSSFIQEMPSSELNGASSTETFSITNNYSSLSKSPSYSSLPLHDLHYSSHQQQQQNHEGIQRGVKETSLQTLKFADDDDDDQFDQDDDDDRNTQVKLLPSSQRSSYPV